MTECNAIIEANNEIDKLKRENQKLNELCVQYGFDMGGLEEENEQLKQQLNYIQNSISENIKHQKTELGQKALKEIIVDYNEWMLGHKEVYE